MHKYFMVALSTAVLLPLGAQATQSSLVPLNSMTFAADHHATLVCYQEGKKIVEIAELATLSPDSNRGIFTISITDHAGGKHTLFPGSNTSCHISENPQ